MAVSKNNRRRTKKRTKNHMSPQKQADKLDEARAESKSSIDWFSLTGFALMLVGFLAATFTPYGLICYPITFVGALMCLIKTKPDTSHHKVSFVCYIIYCVAVAIMWVSLLMNQLSA